MDTPVCLSAEVTCHKALAWFTLNLSCFTDFRPSKHKRIGNPAMSKHCQSASAIIKYSLFQVPEFILFIVILILLDRWLNIPGWIFWLFIIAWVIKDAVLFPFVRKAYEMNMEDDQTSMQGLKGFAKERLNPSGYVRVRGELWKARVPDETRPIEKGERIKVCRIHGLTLIVTPDNEKGSNAEYIKKEDSTNGRNHLEGL